MSMVGQAVHILQAGGVVAFPTETVYGLGADARNPDALRKIFAAKQRPIDHPLIVHLANVDQLSDWAREIPPVAFALAEAFWPGPLTLILKKAPGVSDLVTGHQDTVGLRIPRHPVAQALLRAMGGGIAAPSANRFGRISPTTAQAVREELGDAVDWVLEGGECEVGLESTILDLSGEAPVILRPGMLDVKQIEAVLGQALRQASQDSPRVSGSLESHYAPQTKLTLVNSDDLVSYVKSIMDKPIAVLTRSSFPIQHPNVYIVSMPVDATHYAHDLYRVLRDLDKKNLQQILVEEVPNNSEWAAIQDRLKRASR